LSKGTQHFLILILIIIILMTVFSFFLVTSLLPPEEQAPRRSRPVTTTQQCDSENRPLCREPSPLPRDKGDGSHCRTLKHQLFIALE
jgi:hypothetical protein